MKRQPALYLTHGGGPCFWIDLPERIGPHGYDRLRSYLSGLLATLPERPRAILMCTAHWEEGAPTVSTAASPGMLYDYYGFPPHTYELKYPAPGSPVLARQALDLLQTAGIATATDATRGFDHGVFVPMLIIDPDATVPVTMLSLQRDLDPAYHLRMGAALQSLRDEGILVIGSGSSFHNLRALADGDSRPSLEFDAWLNETVTEADPAARNERLTRWGSAPSARICHPRSEHLLPLMVAVGAAGSDRGHAAFRDLIGGKAYACFSFGEG
jgi:aromatic ring-opening dioxygenase catalytic subunit (LigB family)